MKNIITLIAVLVIIGSACGPTHVVVQTETPAPPPPPPPQEVSYQSFYDELSPYGHWIEYPNYGYVWMPNAGPDFKPYATNGHWVFTDAGWTWASDYDWGWAPFHYGRWFYDNAYGWMWVPGHEWAPAWVSWRMSSDYYGWAPLSPNMGGSEVNVNISVESYNPPSHYWSFVPPQYVTNPRVNNYYVNETKNVTIINNTTVINNTINNNSTINNNTTINNNKTINNNTRNTYVAGPDPREVERVTGAPVRPLAIRQSDRPGAAQVNNGQIAIFRPKANSVPASSNNGATQRVAPIRVENLKDIKPVVANHNNAPATNDRQVEIRNTPAANSGINNNQPLNNQQSGLRNTPAANSGLNNNPPGNNQQQKAQLNSEQTTGKPNNGFQPTTTTTPVTNNGATLTPANNANDNNRFKANQNVNPIPANRQPLYAHPNNNNNAQTAAPAGKPAGQTQGFNKPPQFNNNPTNTNTGHPQNRTTVQPVKPKPAPAKPKSDKELQSEKDKNNKNP